MTALRYTPKKHLSILELLYAAGVAGFATQSYQNQVSGSRTSPGTNWGNPGEVLDAHQAQSPAITGT